MNELELLKLQMELNRIERMLRAALYYRQQEVRITPTPKKPDKDVPRHPLSPNAWIMFGD